MAGVLRCFETEEGVVVPALSSKRYDMLNKLIYSIVSGVVKNKMKSSAVVSCLAELINQKPEVASMIVDVIALIEIETTVLENREDRSRLAGLLQDLNKYLSEELVKERTEIELLGEAKILKNPKKFFNTVIKLKTKIFFKQQKFNLFREESEGYAKLITELNQDLDKVKLSYILQVITTLIGYFNLDPNRVLDIIVESFERQPHHYEFFIELLKQFLSDRNTLKELLHFKYRYYGDKSEEEVTPQCLYTVTALLIIHGVLHLDDVYPWLSPTDETIKDRWQLEVNDAKAFLRKMTVVSTQTKDDDDKNKDKDNKDVNENNQKFGLLAAFYKLSNWDLGEQMLARLPRDYCISQPKVSQALCLMVHKAMDPVYQQYSGVGQRIKIRRYEHTLGAKDPPLAKSLPEFKSVVHPMLKTLGCYASIDPTLLYRILRLFKSGLGIPIATDQDMKVGNVKDLHTKDLYYEALTILDEVILPSLSLLKSNCCLAEEVWSLVRYMPYEHRYRLYDGWKNEALEAQPVLIKTKATCLKTVKRIIMQMAKENVKQTGRKLGKISHATPGPVFAYVCAQVQIADNLVGPIVDSMKYMNNLSFDVLGFCIIESLSDPAKDRTKTDGTSISMWLNNLALFCGFVYKKYNIELTGLLQYVANQLKAKNSLDLLIVKEVVNKMGGIEAVEEMTAEQLEAFSGGDLLRQEAGNFNQVKNTRKSSQRLKECLMEMKLAVPLVLLMAQQGSCVVYQETEDEAPLKLVGKLFDQCHDTLVQFGSFLASNLSSDDYSKVMPPLPQLLSQFFVNPDIAFFLARPMFNHLISGQFEEIRKKDKHWRSRTPQEKQAKHAEAASMIMGPLTQAVVPVYPAKIWDDISPQFLATFWSLTMYDLYVPEDLYTKKIKELKDAPSKLHENRDLNSSKRKKESDRLHVLVEKLQEEEKKHKEHVERVMVRLRQEKDNWFLSRSAKTAKNETITQFLQFCLFPRSIFTANDASYAAKFVKVIHQLKTPNFSTLICFDRTFCDITYTVTACTENEATRYGRFLCAMLETARRWHKDKALFEAECSGYPGFITKFKAAGGEDNAASDRPLTDTVDFENYRHVCHKWHYKIAKALVVCLESKDYVQIRNALIILNEIISQYPLIQNLASVLEKRIGNVCTEEKDKREDLYIKARSYQGKLSMNRHRMVREYDFHKMKNKPEEAKETKEKSSKEESKEEGEIQEDKEKNKDRESKSRDRDTKSRDRETKSRDRDTKSRDRDSRERKSRDRESRDKTDMGPPASTSRKSQDPADSDRDFKRKRDSGKKKDKSPDRLEKKERLRKEKEKLKKLAEEEEAAIEREKESKKERKRDRDSSGESEKKKRREDDDLSPKQNGDSKRKNRR